MAAATTGSPNTSPQRPKGLLEVTITLARVRSGPRSAGRTGSRRRLRRGCPADFVDDEQGVAAEASELVVEGALVMRGGEAGDPFRDGSEQDSVASLAGPDSDPGREVGLAGAGRAEEHDVAVFVSLIA